MRDFREEDDATVNVVVVDLRFEISNFQNLYFAGAGTSSKSSLEWILRQDEKVSSPPIFIYNT